jgi:hypothetical protein
MITQKQIRKAKDLAALDLLGISFEAACEGNGGTDFQSITIRDAQTGTVITIARGPYSDVTIHATTPPKMEKRFIVTSKTDKGNFISDPLKADELDAAKAAHPDPVVTEIEVPVEE